MIGAVTSGQGKSVAAQTISTIYTPKNGQQGGARLGGGSRSIAVQSISVIYTSKNGEQGAPGQMHCAAVDLSDLPL